MFPNRCLRALPVLVLVSACIDIAPDARATDISGTYVGRAVLSDRPRTVYADASQDTATYTLRIDNRDGFVHGLWTIAGDPAQPTDPWEAVVTGDYATDTDRMVLEYHSPVMGQCHLAGELDSNTYTPEYRCADNWSHADTLCLTKEGAAFSPCARTTSDVWMGLQIRTEGPRVGYNRSDFGTGYSSLEDEIIEALPKSGDGSQVYTPYTCTLYDIRADGTAATDIDHIVALAEAYDSGLSPTRYREFGRDLENLTVAVPSVNRNQKSDKDAAEWGPDKNTGWYAARIVAVKRKYSMSVDPAERDSLAAMLRADSSRTVTCP
ncbi:MAG: hypothetical protein OXR82_17525 [Gammaproteobacteria bacterium]|nr:hypothetical protein [Gammaproteobacteria bacterium]